MRRPFAVLPCLAPRWRQGAAALILTSLMPLTHAQTPRSAPYEGGESTSAPKQTPPWQRIELGKSGHRYTIPVYANRNLARGNLRDIKQIVVVFHGIERNADAYYQTAATLLAANPARARDTLILAPRFVSVIDSGFAGMAAWRKSGWADGGNSARADGRPAPVSAFQVIDDLLRNLNNRKRLPTLASIVLAGHSAGAQLVQRYAVLNPIDGQIRRDGIALRYVIANPSSYLYLTNERPRPDGKGYAPYERGICPTYNQYKYGTDRLPAYARDANGAKLFARYAARDVTYLLGSADNNPEHRLLDKTCGAEAQGATRLARGIAYLRYERIAAARGARPVTLHHTGFEVTGVGHNDKDMFGSVCGARAAGRERHRAIRRRRMHGHSSGGKIARQIPRMPNVASVWRVLGATALFCLVVSFDRLTARARSGPSHANPDPANPTARRRTARSAATARRSGSWRR